MSPATKRRCARGPIRPSSSLGGVTVSDSRVDALIWDFLRLKQEFNPSLASPTVPLSDLLSFEVKGSNLRADLRSTSRNRRRRAVGFLDKLVLLLEEHHVQLLAEVHIKNGSDLGRWVYPRAISHLAQQFEVQLRAGDQRGLMVLDARTKSKNVPKAMFVPTEFELR